MSKLFVISESTLDGEGQGAPVNSAPQGKDDAYSVLQIKREITEPFFSGKVVTSEETKSEGTSPIQNKDSTESATESSADAIRLEGSVGASPNCSRYVANVDHSCSRNSKDNHALNKSRDLPRRVPSNRRPLNSKRLAASRSLEDPPNKIRKLNSENKRPPDPPYSTQSNEGSIVKNLVDLEPIIGNIKNEIETDWSPLLQDTITDHKDIKREEIQTNDSVRNGVIEEINIHTSSKAASSSSKIMSSSSITSYKEKNSSIKINDCKLSQALIQFHLLGRKFVTLKDLAGLDASHSLLGTVVVVASMLTSPFTSCLVVADATTCSRLNLVGQAAKVWHSRLKIGQVLLLTKMGVLVEGGYVRVVQIACKEGVKVVGMVVDVEDLSMGQHCNLMVRMNDKPNKFCCRKKLKRNANEDKETAEIMADLEINANEDEERTEVINGSIVAKSSPSFANENAKKAVLADSDDSDEDLEVGTNRKNTVDIEFTEVKKKCEISSDADDMVYHGMVYSLTEDVSNDSSLTYEVIDDDKPNAASAKKIKEDTISSFDSLITGERVIEVEEMNTTDEDFYDLTVRNDLRKRLPHKALRHRKFKDLDRIGIETLDTTEDDNTKAMNASIEHQASENVLELDTENEEAVKVISTLDSYETDDGTVQHNNVTLDGDQSDDSIIYHSILGKRNLSKAADGRNKEKENSEDKNGPEDDGDDREVDRDDDDREVDRLCNLEGLDGERHARVRKKSPSRVSAQVKSKEETMDVNSSSKILSDDGNEAGEIGTDCGIGEEDSEMLADCKSEEEASKVLTNDENEASESDNSDAKKSNKSYFDNILKMDYEIDNILKTDEDDNSFDENEQNEDGVTENKKKSKIVSRNEVRKNRKPTPYLLRFPLSESDEDEVKVERKKKLRRNPLFKKKSSVFSEDSTEEEFKNKSSVFCEDSTEEEFIERSESRNIFNDRSSSDSSEIDFVKFKKRKLQEGSSGNRSRRLGASSDRPQKIKVEGPNSKNHYVRKSKRNIDGSDSSNASSSSDGSSPEDNSGEVATAPGGDDCSCPKCSPESYDMVTFSQRDMVTACCKAVRNIPASPAKDPVELDTYLVDVNVSFEEDGKSTEPGADLDNSVASQLAIFSQGKSQANKTSAFNLEEIWLGRDNTVAAKARSKGKKTDGEQNNANGGTTEEKEQVEEDIVEEEGEYGVKETYIEYKPVYLTDGIDHPDIVVESSSLASVSPPAITRSLSLPRDVIDAGKLSKVQLESVTYASQMHEVIMHDNSRAGYLIGDGAGVGKGRTIAGIILENWICGRKKSVWISASQDLLHDAARDLEDIGVENIRVVNLSSFGYDKKLKGEMVVYSTFAGLVGTSKVKTRRYKSRLDQLQEWLGLEGQFDGPLVFDECHKAKNLVPPKGGKPTKTGLAVLALQAKNPSARVVYASATGASEPKNMAYMVRLGMWGQNINFNDFKEFSRALERRGTGGLEQVALDLKLRGSYIARQLSFKGVEFTVEEVPLGEEFIEVYNESVEVWRKLKDELYKQCKMYPIKGRGDPRIRMFWGFMQKFFKYLAISSKIRYVVGLAKRELKRGNCVVIGLQSTGEAATELEMITKTKGNLKDEEMRDFINDDSDTDSDDELPAEKTTTFSSAACKIMRSVVGKLIPCQHNQIMGLCDPERCEEREDIWKVVLELVPRLPTSSLDQLIEELGGPGKVAELTGRKKRLEKGCDGQYSYVKRTSEDNKGSDINMAEKKLFMAGRKKIAIISEAGSTGISLQADKRVKNQRRRIHFTIELPWSADSAIQQFGRTHRSNQSSAPKYVFVISALHGEKRFASIVAKRLESLGALTHGDRRSTRTSDLSSFNFHTEHATTALKCLVLAITEGESIPMPPHPPRWKEKEEFYSWLADRMEEAGIYDALGVMEDEQYPTMTKFMNRLLCVKVEHQNVIFSYFSATLDRVIAQAKREGRYDSGIVDVVGQEKASLVDQHTFEVRHATGITTTKVTKLLITRGMSFQEALHKSQQLKHKTEGFWLSLRQGTKYAILVIAIPDAGDYHYWNYLIYRPNTGQVFDKETYDDLRDKYRKVSPEVAKKFWDKQYELSLDLCFHAFRSKDHTCKTIRNGGECEEGRRRRNYHVISGSLLSVWPQIEQALGSCSVKRNRKIQMIRINNNEGRIIGIKIPNQVAGKLIDSLKDIEKKINTEGDGETNDESGNMEVEKMDREHNESVNREMGLESESEIEDSADNRGGMVMKSETDSDNKCDNRGMDIESQSELEYESCKSGAEKESDNESVNSHSSNGKVEKNIKNTTQSDLEAPEAETASEN